MKACKGVMIAGGTRHCFVAERNLGRQNEFQARTSKKKEPLAPSIDHWLPRSQGGTDAAENLHIVHAYDQWVQGASLGNKAQTETPGFRAKHMAYLRSLHTPESLHAAAVKGGEASKLIPKEVYSEAGKKGGRALVESGKHIENLEKAWAAGTPQERSERGQKARSASGCNCVRWNIKRGKPCVCVDNRHQHLEEEK